MQSTFAGAWRWIYVVGASVTLYFNVFVGIVQSFEKIPALKAMAPTQSEPPFKLTQLVVLALFVILTLVRSDQIPTRADSRSITMPQ